MIRKIPNIKIGLSSAICFWDISEAFRLAKKFGIGIEILPFRWQYKKITELSKKFPEVEILGFHAPFNKDYIDCIKTAMRGWTSPGAVFSIIWGLLLGPATKSPAITLAKDFDAYINFHPNSFIPVKDCRVFIENPTDKEEGCCPMEVVRLAYKHSVGMTFDCSHAAELYKTASSFLGAYCHMAPKNIHFSDSILGQTQKHFIPGDGNLPLHKLLELFAKNAKKSDEQRIIIELAPAYNKKVRETAIEKSLRFINKALE